MNAFQAKLANVRFLVVGGRCARNLKIVFLQTTFKGNVSECARVTRLVVLFPLLVPLFLFFSLRPQWALAKISAGHVTGKNI